MTPKSDINQVIVKSELIQTRMNHSILSMVKERQMTAADSMLANALNQVSSYHKRRVAAASDYRIPDTIWPALYAILTFSLRSRSSSETVFTQVRHTFGLSCKTTRTRSTC